MNTQCLFIISLPFCLFSCKTKPVADKDHKAAERKIPDTSFWNKPIASFDTSDYVIELKHMQEFYDVPGEFGYIAEGKDYGFKSLSFIMTNTQPNVEGNILYTMGDKTFSAKGPYILRIPAGIPHTFINTGNQVLHLTAVFPSHNLSYKELGRNPLVKDTGVYHKH